MFITGNSSDISRSQMVELYNSLKNYNFKGIEKNEERRVVSVVLNGLFNGSQTIKVNQSAYNGLQATLKLEKLLQPSSIFKKLNKWIQNHFFGRISSETLQTKQQQLWEHQQFIKNLYDQILPFYQSHAHEGQEGELSHARVGILSINSSGISPIYDKMFLMKTKTLTKIISEESDILRQREKTEHLQQCEKTRSEWAEEQIQRIQSKITHLL